LRSRGLRGMEGNPAAAGKKKETIELELKTKKTVVLN